MARPRGSVGARYRVPGGDFRGVLEGPIPDSAPRHTASWMVFKTADVVKAEGGVGFGQKGLMMELQSLQEALKVEIQIHQKLVAQMKQDPQNAELKLQLHDLQAKITALSERQERERERERENEVEGCFLATDLTTRSVSVTCHHIMACFRVSGSLRDAGGGDEDGDTDILKEISLIIQVLEDQTLLLEERFWLTASILVHPIGVGMELSSGYNPSLQGILLGTVPGKGSTTSGPADQFSDKPDVLCCGALLPCWCGASPALQGQHCTVTSLELCSLCIHGFAEAALFSQKKVVEQLRRDLLVKQESAEIRLQTQTQLPLLAEGKTTTLVSSQSQSLPPPHLSAPQNSVSVTPVIATKTLPLVLRAATPTTPIAMMPTPTIAMVTTLTNTPLASLPNSDPQSSPISLQTCGKPVNQGSEPVRIVPKNTIVVQATAQPIKVPQFVPPTRQTARPASLPQVMPKPPASVTPGTLQPILASPQSLQQPVLLAAKLSSALLPTSGPVHQLHIFSPQPAVTQPCLSNAQPGPTVTQPCPTVAQPCPTSAQPSSSIIQPCPTITMTLNTNISQLSTTGTLHNSTHLPSIIITPKPAQLQAASSIQPSSNSTSTDAHQAARSSNACPDAPTPVAVDGTEPKTTSSTLQSSAPASTASSPNAQSNTPTPAASHPPTAKRQENPLKLAFMVSLGLVTHDYLEEIQSKRQERKRRTTANPVYSGAVFEPEVSPDSVTAGSSRTYCSVVIAGRPPKHSSAVERGHSPLTPTSRHPASLGLLQPSMGGPHSPALPQTLSSHPPPSSPRVSPSSERDGDIHDDFCVVCRRSGQLLMCDTCSRVYHLDCLEPPLRTVPKGMWICPSCQSQILKKDEAIEWPGTLAIVHSYISYKAEREQEKQRLEKWSSELQLEREELQLRVKQLSDSLTICMESRSGVLSRQREMEASIEKVKGLVRLIRGIQLPCLTQPKFPPTGLANGDPGPASTQHPETIQTSEEDQHRDVKNNSKDSIPATVSSASTDLSDTSNLNSGLNNSNATNTDGSASSPGNTDPLTDAKNASTSRCASSISPVLSNTHGQNATRNASSNGPLEPEDGHEENSNKNTDKDINSIRDLRGSADPPLPAVMPIAEVIQGVE
ncbi:hypothetical protein NFI96_014581 [Prochilodus magdalenae]|nr:hypothetical protein NFI96_014581 [Prochilodus magdalenae]